MRIAIKDHRGYYGTTWDGPNLKFDRKEIGPGETFEVIDLDALQPPPPSVPPWPTFTGSAEEWFTLLVAGKPFGQATLLALEPQLNANGWKLTPANAAGDRSKVLPGGQTQWVRVGFGEGQWVWIPQ